MSCENERVDATLGGRIPDNTIISGFTGVNDDKSLAENLVTSDQEEDEDEQYAIKVHSKTVVEHAY